MTDPTAMLLSSWAASARALLLRDLMTLRRQVEAYPDTATLWAMPAGVPNAAGTLVLHLCGGLRHFVGAQLGASGYVRDRDREFAQRDVSAAELLTLIDTTMREIEAAFAQLSSTRFGDPYPIEVMQGTAQVGDWVTHLATHVAYHLGQVDYHRRVVTGQTNGLDAVKGSRIASWSARPSS
jgi:uncharacterized damage-inducible protein DinB